MATSVSLPVEPVSDQACHSLFTLCHRRGWRRAWDGHSSDNAIRPDRKPALCNRTSGCRRLLAPVRALSVSVASVQAPQQSQASGHSPPRVLNPFATSSAASAQWPHHEPRHQPHPQAELLTAQTLNIQTPTTGSPTLHVNVCGPPPQAHLSRTSVCVVDAPSHLIILRWRIASLRSCSCSSCCDRMHHWSQGAYRN